ncbi:AzlC family ABC transporter permease [Stappia sp. F7233]|uniref:AzlC family ABC transporter permease n=2 Tax=Stappia albiluteola TaxID=2758565 RepID=A0A839AG89_9HYPH|nr:AzlC family ABC transporter permease [Stappia albiluteola]
MPAPPRRSIAAEFTAGATAIAPIVIAAVPIGLLFGAVAAQRGLSSLEIALMSATVFAGGSQFVAIDIWQQPVAIMAIAFSALLVNLRHILMGASISPKLREFRGWQKYVALFFLADEIWAMAEKRALGMPLAPAFFAGLAAPLYFAWVSTTTAGSMIGAALGDPSRFGFDFVFPAVFICLVMGFWKGAKTGAVLLASALSAIATHHVIEGAWYVAAGALAGVVVAALAADAGNDTARPDTIEEGECVQ